MAPNEAGRCLFPLIQTLQAFWEEGICIASISISGCPIFPDPRLSARDSRGTAPRHLRSGSGPQSWWDPRNWGNNVRTPSVQALFGELGRWILVCALFIEQHRWTRGVCMVREGLHYEVSTFMFAGYELYDCNMIVYPHWSYLFMVWSEEVRFGRNTINLHSYISLREPHVRASNAGTLGKL